MNLLNDRVNCEYGWSICPPHNWVRLADSVGEPVLSPAQAIVFSKSDDWDLMLSWMVRGYPVSQEVAQAFAGAINSGTTLKKEIVSPLVNAIFPLIGELDTASVFTFVDGSKA